MKHSFANSLFRLLFALLFITSLPSCTGEDGLDGEDGEDGIDGIDGIDGQDGQDGKDGVANLLIDTFRVYESSNVTFGFKWNATGYYYEHYHSLPEITDTITNGGVVLCYLSTGNGWFLLPWTVIISTNTESRTWNFGFSTGQIYLLVEQSDQSDPDVPWDISDSGYLYKYAIIPPAIKKANDDIDWTNSEQIMNRFPELNTNQVKSIGLR
jgi:hypothetical protein